MAAPPESTKTSLQQTLSGRARERRPQLAGVDVKFRGAYAYVAGRITDDETLPLMRLKYGGYAPPGDSRSTWPAKTATNPQLYPTARWRDSQKTPWTAPAASTSATPPPGPEPPTNLRT